MLQRRKALVARTGLQPGRPLERKKPLEPVARRRREEVEATGKPVKPALSTKWRPAVPPRVKAALEKRSGGWCEMRLPGCLGRATDPAHRIGQGSGGRHGEAKVRNDRLSNLLHACRTCHEWTHREDALAKEDGLRLKNGCVPAREPVLYRGVLSYLTDDGRVIDFHDMPVMVAPVGAGEETPA